MAEISGLSLASEQCGAEYARSNTRFLKRKCGMAQSQENERWQIR
jgi:hypothetical protein